jgi:hypothetical protein
MHGSFGNLDFLVKLLSIGSIGKNFTQGIFSDYYIIADKIAPSLYLRVEDGLRGGGNDNALACRDRALGQRM